MARKQFFFEKKNQKTFTLLVDAAGKIGAYRGEQKFFGFFSKKNCFLRTCVALQATRFVSIWRIVLRGHQA
jgi:hypothetical protein